ncbi:hypothetical protein [Kitasatospora sp. CB01950]|uniref:hypothetical protein n=1 Tax=Kitasatospora sp. CB01950 TaxID=1703930 RepID=UPI0011614E34|nr:hypothetical protein [Kitasatospora sp. CB01950]
MTARRRLGLGPLAQQDSPVPESDGRARLMPAERIAAREQPPAPAAAVPSGRRRLGLGPLAAQDASPEA